MYYNNDVMTRRIRAMFYIDADVLADLREYIGKRQAEIIRAGGDPSEADNMSDIAAAAIRTELAKRKKKAGA